MESVAAFLPVQPLGPSPFTLGEAVAELGLWAAAARIESWDNQHNRESLDQDISSALAAVGPRLRAVIGDLLPALVTAAGRQTIVQASAEFAKRWQRPSAVSASFRDLAETADSDAAGSWRLRPAAEILASQIGAAHRSWGLLDQASTVLAGDPHPLELKHWLGHDVGEDLTPLLRLEIADRALTSSDSNGKVVVWLLYRRANIGLRLAAGPITFLRPGWAIPNATRVDGQEFEERDELRALLEGPLFPNADELLSEDATEEQFVLVRVDMGSRSAAGAREEATQRVEALISLAVGAGGASWLNTGHAVTLVDGRHPLYSFGGAQGQNRDEFIDSYGINTTGGLLHDWATRLDSALSSGPMPGFLIEAIDAVREASMVEHRDVHFTGARPVTPRVAIALQDHAVELVSSLAQMRPKDLVSALEDSLIDHYWGRLVVESIWAPLDTGHLSRLSHSEVEGLKFWFAPPEDSGVRRVHLDRVWNERGRLQAIKIPPALGHDLQEGLAAISSTVGEAIFVDRARHITRTLRARHRRVRNAITHGNPVTPAAIDSVREFSDQIARRALNLALKSYAANEAISSVLAANHASRQVDHEQMVAGVSRKDRLAAAGTAESSSS